MIARKEKPYPLLTSLIVLLVWITIVVIGPDFLHHRAPESLDEGISRNVNIQLALAPVFLLVAIALLRWWRETGLKGARLRSEYKFGRQRRRRQPGD